LGLLLGALLLGLLLGALLLGLLLGALLLGLLLSTLLLRLLLFLLFLVLLGLWLSAGRYAHSHKQHRADYSRRHHPVQGIDIHGNPPQKSGRTTGCC
jgi:hypothetical protein